MRVCFVSKGVLSSFCKEYGYSKADITLVASLCEEELSYEKELKGETAFVERLALLSKASKSVAAGAAITDTRGLRRHSVVVAENGRVLGVSDALNALDGEYNPGIGLKTYDTKAGKLGVIVGNDLYFSELFRTLAVCGCDLVLCFTDEVRYEEGILLRAAAFSYGLPICLCGRGYSLIADESASLAFSSPHSPVEYAFESKRSYRLLQTRQRGFYRSNEADY